MKGKEKGSVNHWERGSKSLPSPTVGRLVNFLWSFFRGYFVHTAYSLKGKLGKRSGHSLITYSSFLLLWSTEGIDRLGKISCDQKVWKVCFSWRLSSTWSAWFKSWLRYTFAKVKRQRTSCRDLFPAKSFSQLPHSTPCSLGFPTTTSTEPSPLSLCVVLIRVRYWWQKTKNSDGLKKIGA